MKKKVKLNGQELIVQTNRFELQPGETLLSTFSVDEMLEMLKPFQADFDKLFDNKKSTDLLLERFANPAKYPDFHFHLDVVHELWIKGVIA